MIAIIDYNAGNTASVCNALERIGQEFCISDNASFILGADKVIFPGVGNAKSAIQDLKIKGLDEVIKKIKRPFLGICLGLQLLTEFSEEGDTSCLGLVEGRVKKFKCNLKVPQIGWNKVFQGSAVEKRARCSLFSDIPDESYFYFVNSYYLPVLDFTVGISFYGNEFSSVVHKDNFFATQFHPEKSGDIGLRLLNNFCKLC